MQPEASHRDLALLPKAHLHLHFTGSLDVPTLRELAELADVPLPDHLLDAEALSVPATTRGWHRFQRSYETARLVVTSEEAMRRVVQAAVANDVREGSRRLELQIDPSSYAVHVGGLVEALEIVLDEARNAGDTYGLSVGVIVAASRMRHPMEAETLARLAARHAGDGPGQVVAFGLSNDEHAGITEEWTHAFAIARRAGLPGVPHGGELSGPEHVRRIVDSLGPARLGHGVRTAEDPALLEELVSRGIAFEVCPTSNVHLGVYENLADVPLRTMVEAGATVALGADDPLLFFSRLTDQYELARDVHGFTDAELAALASSSITASLASPTEKKAWLAEVDAWLATEPD
ncbi:MAG TPA: adenosine deaminase [Propionibacteriaceae bacterium]